MGEEKKTAVYLMVWNSELEPRDKGSYDRPIEAQKKLCLDFLKSKGEDTAQVTFYTSRRDLFTDIEKDVVGRLVVRDLKRLGSDDEIEGILFELKMNGIQLLTVD